MTSFATSQVIACPHCRHLALRRRLQSLNFYGCTFWSDGYVGGFSGLPSFTRCTCCQGVYWLADAEVVGVLPDARSDASRGFLPAVRRWLNAERDCSEPSSQPVPDEWQWARPVGHADTDALVIGIESLADAEAPIEREQTLRRLLWWQFNHEQRRRSTAVVGISATVRSAHAQSNLFRLLDLAEGDGSMKGLERAELLRELGRFDEARAALTLVGPDTRGITVLAAKIEAHDSKVCVTYEESW